MLVRWEATTQPGSPTQPGEGNVVQMGLAHAAKTLRAQGYPSPSLEGHLYRPLAALLAVPRGRAPTDGFWMGALAVQMAHEASLLHDDVLDGAMVRRDRPTLQSTHGAGRALLQGDRLLTTAYCAAELTGSPAFMAAFVRATQATVTGETGQAAARGRVIGKERYERIIAGKTGALFGVSVAAHALIHGHASADDLHRLGVRLGSLFQRIDDFLDYCPAAATGKAVFSDLRRGTWTWVLEPLGSAAFELTEDQVLRRVLGDGNGSGPGLLREGLQYLKEEAARIHVAFERIEPEAPGFREMTEQWLRFCERALTAQVGRGASMAPRDAPSPPDHERGGERLHPAEWVREAARRVGPREAWPAYFGRNSRSFQFASRWFPREARDHVTGLYAFCRFTDDIVDEHTDVPAAVRSARLDAWLHAVRRAHAGDATGIDLVDEVMGLTARRNVGVHYAEELIEGVRMDLLRRRYGTEAELRLYTFRVASVVGGWMTELFGRRDPWILDRAYALGHAMQLTNIVRDVGEDLDDDRIYLPADLMRQHDVDEAGLRAMRAGTIAITDGYRALVDTLIRDADRHYEAAFRAIPALPRFFQRPVAIASNVYRGIHDDLRKHGYDNLCRRAHTSGWDKLRLGAAALRRLRRERRELDAERGGVGQHGWLERA